MLNFASARGHAVIDSQSIKIALVDFPSDMNLLSD